MGDIEWIIVSIGTAVLTAVVGSILIWRMRLDRRSGVPLQEERTSSQGLVTLGMSLVVLGIVFGTDRLIAYSFIGAGVLLSIISVVKSRRKEQRSSVEMR